MVKVFETNPAAITISQLSINPGELSGDLISGGIIKNFSSTGIVDSSSKQTLIIEDEKITVKSIKTEKIEGNLEIRGDVKIYGIIDAGFVRTTEIIANQRYEKQFLEFANPAGAIGTGLLWASKPHNKQLVVRNNPDRFWLTDHIDIPSDKSYLINGTPALSEGTLGSDITNSNLQKLGNLRELNVSGPVNVADYIFFNNTSQRIGIGTDNPNALLSFYDYNNDVEIVIDTDEKATGKFGTYNNRGLEIITDNQTRLTIERNGNITIGHEYKDSTITRIYGKLSVGVKNPTEQLEVAGNMRWGNRLFTNGNQPPSNERFNKGDIVWNTDPKPNAYIGWVCIESGIPGLWKPFGLISN